MYWNPACASEKKKALPASFHELRVRFVKESSLKKSELFPDVDRMDVSTRQENLPLGGEPVLLQLPLVLDRHLTFVSMIASFVLCFTCLRRWSPPML